ncbi:DNA modification methylase [Cenarchaeum symbiosum A]|uniref:DNA modification methylase n=1 Tax=Cenarchaeum symbiosum (strain A) TaxID=414004 RepID=A0RWK0_CENSY|nr:DNA modification methylase [Cenarchaeum symbiosum A]
MKNTVRSNIDNHQELARMNKMGINEVNIDGNTLKLANGFEECERIANDSIDVLITDPPSNTYYHFLDKIVPSRISNRGMLHPMPINPAKRFGSELLASNWVNFVLPKIRKRVIIFSLFETKNYIQELKKLGFNNLKLFLWEKSSLFDDHIVTGSEHIIVGEKTNNEFKENFIEFKYRSSLSEYVMYPEQKPLQLIEKSIKHFTDINDSILDPFGGSGTTMLASMKTGRKSTTFEWDECVYNMAKCRVGNYPLILAMSRANENLDIRNDNDIYRSRMHNVFQVPLNYLG